MPYLVCESLGLALGRACREASFLLRRPQADLEPLPRSSAKCRLPNKQRSGGPLGCRGRSSIPGNSGISSITFGAAAARFWEAQQSRWRNAKVRPGWVGFMRRHAAKIWNVPVDQVDQTLMVQILQSIWIANSALYCLFVGTESAGAGEKTLAPGKRDQFSLVSAFGGSFVAGSDLVIALPRNKSSAAMSCVSLAGSLAT